MSDDRPPLSDNPQPSSTDDDPLMDLPSSYQTNDPPHLEPPPPTDSEPELEEISPKDLSVKEIGEENDQSRVPPPSEESTVAEPPENWKPSKIMRRADWGAAKPKWIDALDIPVDKVVVSFTETDPCYTEEECQAFVRRLQQEHMAEENVPDIKHNFLIGGDEVIYEGRGYMRVGPTYNPSPKKIEELTGKSIDIAVIERSASNLSEAVVGAISYCIAWAVTENCVTRDFYTYYVVDGEIDTIRPPIQENPSDETK